MNFENEYTLSVPKFQNGLLKIDLTKAREAEGRMHEVSYVNRSTAQELMSLFVKARTDVRDNMTRVRYEYLQTIEAIERRKSLIVLEIVPAEAAKRGVATKASPSGSEDFRNAIINMDSEYQRLVDLSNLLKSTHEFLSNRAETFLNSYNQIKKIYSSDELEDHGLRSENVSGSEGIGLSRY